MVRDTAETRFDTLKTKYDCGTITVIWLLLSGPNGKYGFIISKSLVSTGILSSLGLPEHWPTSHRLNLHAVSQHRIYYIIHFLYQFSHFLFSKTINIIGPVTIYLSLYLLHQMSMQPPTLPVHLHVLAQSHKIFQAHRIAYQAITFPQPQLIKQYELFGRG